MRTTLIPRRTLLDPVERVSEIIFGLIMVLTFTTTLSVAEADRVEIRTMVISALGCNIAWGVVDAVMYLINTLTGRIHGRDPAVDPTFQPRLERDDWLGAAAVFLLVFLSTLPVVMPFVFMEEPHRALRVSNGVAISMLFLCGYTLGTHASWRPWRTGAIMAAVGIALVAITIALGG